MKKYIILMLLCFALCIPMINHSINSQISIPEISLQDLAPAFRNPSGWTNVQSFSLASNAVIGGVLSDKYTCGKTLSPDISWNNFSGDNHIKSYVLVFAAANTRSYWESAYDSYRRSPDLLMNSSYIPMCNTGALWMIYNIPTFIKSIQEGWRPGTGGIELQSYRGPCFGTANQIEVINGKAGPSSKSCSYEFIVYAIDILLDPEKTKNIDDVMAQIVGHVIARGSLRVNVNP